MYEAQGLRFMDCRDEDGSPARLGAGYAEGGMLVLQQTSPVIHLSLMETLRYKVMVAEVSAEARDYRP